MDLSTTIMGIVILLICALPIILSAINRSRKKKKTLQVLFDFATKNNCKLNQYELSNNLTIGIDIAAQMVFFAKQSKDNVILQQINLSQIQKCRLVNSSRSVKNKESNFSVVEKIELVFTYQDKNKKDGIWEFYNHLTDGPTFSGEMLFIEKWCKFINDKISAID